MKKINLIKKIKYLKKPYWINGILFVFLLFFIIGFLFKNKEGLNTVLPDPTPPPPSYPSQSPEQGPSNSSNSPDIQEQKCNDDNDCNRFIPGLYDYNINVKFTENSLMINKLPKKCINNTCK
jgi:hypothetical protein